MSKMTPEIVKAIAKKHGGYANPVLNDQLFLHCQGFDGIANLEPYTELKVLWLEQNAIEAIEGLDKNEKLVTIFLQNNIIRNISGLTNLNNLRIINLSHNFLSSIKHMAEYCPLLETLQISHNTIESLEDCEELQRFKHLSCVDLSFNKLDRPEGSDDDYVHNFFSKMSAIACLYLHGQPLCRGIRNYRKNMVWHIKTLTYLDERPVFADERRTVEAWGNGGTTAESAEREAIRKEKHDHLTGCVKTLADMAEKMKDVRAARTIEWEKQKEAERKRQQDNLVARRAMNYDEEDARVIIQTDESSEWVELVEQLGKELLEAEEEDEARQAELSEKNALEAVAQMEIAREAATLEAMAEAAEAATNKVERSKRKDEIAYWVKQMEMTEDEIITQMEDEMTEMLKMMRPMGGYRDISGMAAAAVVAAEDKAAPTSSGAVAADGEASVEAAAAPSQQQKHLDPMAAAADETNTAVPTPLNNATTTAKRPKFSKERVWAQYDAWESLQMGRRGKKV